MQYNKLYFFKTISSLSIYKNIKYYGDALNYIFESIDVQCSFILEVFKCIENQDKNSFEI